MSASIGAGQRKVKSILVLPCYRWKRSPLSDACGLRFQLPGLQAYLLPPHVIASHCLQNEQQTRKRHDDLGRIAPNVASVYGAVLDDRLRAGHGGTGVLYKQRLSTVLVNDHPAAATGSKVLGKS